MVSQTNKQNILAGSNPLQSFLFSTQDFLNWDTLKIANIPMHDGMCISQIMFSGYNGLMWFRSLYSSGNFTSFNQWNSSDMQNWQQVYQASDVKVDDNSLFYTMTAYGEYVMNGILYISTHTTALYDIYSTTDWKSFKHLKHYDWWSSSPDLNASRLGGYKNRLLLGANGLLTGSKDGANWYEIGRPSSSLIPIEIVEFNNKLFIFNNDGSYSISK